MTSKLATGDYDITGKLTVSEDAFVLTLEGHATGTEPPDQPPPDQPPTDLPADAVILTPTGGDDTQLLRDAVGSLPEGGTLALRGMFRVSDTIRLEGGRRRTVCGYPGERSGLLIESADMPGPYGAMLHFVNAIGSTMRGLEFDAQGHSTMPIEVEGGEDNTIDSCYIHDIGYVDTNDPTLAAIHSESGTRLRVVRNRIERTGGQIEIDSGIRGIWLGKGQVDPVVEENYVTDTGHTCIAVEPCSGVVRNNKAYNSLTQGSLYKITGHPQAAYLGKVEFYGNYGEHSKNTGFMVEAGAFQSIDAHHNHFKNCGSEGTSFGAFYTSQWTTTNLHFHDNVIENCRSQGAMLRSDSCLIENNTITGEATLWLESDCKNITVNNSGNVYVGSNCSGIVVNGQQVA